MDNVRFYSKLGVFSFFVCLLLGVSVLSARELSFDEAIDIAVNKSRQSEIIKGDLEVAERTYYAKKVKFYLSSKR